MPTDSYLPNKDADLAVWLGNFIQVANANLATLHLTNAQMVTLGTDTTNFNTATAAVKTLKVNAKAATVTRTMARKKATADARTLVKQVQATSGVPDNLKTQLGITVSAGRRPVVPVFQPVNLTAVVKPDLRVLLKWEKGGNHYGTMYVVERQCAGETTWTRIKTQTATRLYDSGCAPGVHATYRVTAERGLLVSMPSVPASVY